MYKLRSMCVCVCVLIVSSRVIQMSPYYDLCLRPLYHRLVCVLSASRDFLTAEDKEGVFNADHFPLWYKRAAEQVPGTFVYSLPFNSG